MAGFRLGLGVSAAALLVGLAGAWGQGLPTGDGGAVQYAAADDITVTATRTARRTDEVPATVTVITDEEIEDNLATDIKDLVRFEPGVTVRTAPARFQNSPATAGRDGNSGFNIRGLEGNRVLIQVDGIRVPDGFTFGAQSVGRGDYVDLDLLKSVEILRGPASALYGSDGVAGAVSFVTKDPADFLDADQTFGGRVRVAYSSADDAWAEGLVGAFGGGVWSAVIAYTRRDGHETETKGDNDAPNTLRTEANPQDIEQNSVLGKIVFAPTDNNAFRLTYEHLDRAVDTNVLSAVTPPPGGGTLAFLADDDTDRDRASLDHRYSGDGFIDRAFSAIYWQQSSADQFFAEDRELLPDRTRLNTFDTEVWGATIELESGFTLGVPNTFVYGADYSVTTQEGLRDGTIPPIGEFFPVRAFPNTDYTLAGVYAQDEIAFAGGKFLVYPAVRYDYYDLDATADGLYPLPAGSQSDDHVSPKLGVVWWPVETFGLFANYAEGFKAPAPSQVNNFFENPIFGYTSLPNPDLRPETSETIEGGVRLRKLSALGGIWAASATAFTGDYEDFIEQTVVGGTGAPGDPLLFQFVNLSGVEISGLEGKVESRWGSGFGFDLAASYAEGDQETGGASAPLPSIEPFKVIGGVSYRDPAGRFGGQLVVTYSDGKDADDATGACTGPCFLPPSFTLVDATAYLNLWENATLRAGVFNITDEKYWWWNDVAGQLAASPVNDAFTQPGTNFGASLTLRF